MIATKFLMAGVFVVVMTATGITVAQSSYTQFVDTPSDNVRGMVLEPEGSSLFLSDDKAILQYSLTTNSFVNSGMHGHKSAVLSLSISADGQWLVSAGRDSTIVVWDKVTGTAIKRLRHHRAEIVAAVLSKNKSMLVSAGTDNNIIVYDLTRQSITHEINAGSQLTSLALSPDEKVIATGGESKSVTLYSVETGQLIQKIEAHTNWVRGVAYNDTGSGLMSWSDDSKAYIWNVADLSKINQINAAGGRGSWITAFALNKEDESIFATGTLRGEVRLHFSRGEYLRKTGVPINQIVFLPMVGQILRIAVATRGKGVIIMDARGMKFHN